MRLPCTRAWGDYETELNGGGVWCEPGAVLSNCIVGGCVADQDGGGAFRGTLYDCTLVGNACGDDGAGACESVLWRCLLRENDTEDQGGGLYQGSATACRLLDNTSLDHGGGAIFATLRDCVVAGNSANYTGGGTALCTNRNCTIVGNTALGGGGVYGGTMTNCIVWGNAGVHGANWEENGFDEPPAHCCTTPQPTGTGHVTVSPSFTDMDNGDYRLTAGSPCIDAGTNAAVTMAADLDGNPRIVFGTVDMGAYEYVSSTSDYDGDGLSNDEEGIAGTDVTDPDSRLAFISILATGATELVWIGGTQTRQFVEMKTDLASTTEQWVVIHTNEPPTPITNALALPGAPAPTRFYRIRVEGQ